MNNALIRIFAPPSTQVVEFQRPMEILKPNAGRRERGWQWRLLALMSLAMFAMAGLSSASGEVKSLDGTIKFDSNFDGAPEAVLNSMGLGLGTTNPSDNLHVAGNAIVSGTMVVGGTSNTSGSNLHISGSLGFSVQTVTGNTTLSGNSLVLVDTSSRNITLTLPLASTVSGRLYTVKKTSNSHIVFIRCSTSGFLLQLSSTTMGYPYAEVISNGTAWYLIRQSSSGSSYMGDTYLTVDVSGGPTATSYPVSYQATAPDLTGSDNILYKTNKIVLRYIPAATFTMGSPSGELGRVAGNESQHSVTLTHGFYIGVFELTQKQFLNVVGSYPVSQSFTNSSNTMPLQQVSYSDIRGPGNTSESYDYPNSGNAVLSSCFMGLLRSKSGVNTFDLPTEAQWEYACRASTSGGLNNGAANVQSTAANIEDPHLKTLGWYDWNATTGGGGFVGSQGTREVGAKLPNAWGLFDMHGNVWEWTLDWFVSNNTIYTTNPVGPSSGSNRTLRGGSWSNTADYCRSASRSIYSPNTRTSIVGFRLALLVGQYD